jgi:hypothetical protein
MEEHAIPERAHKWDRHRLEIPPLYDIDLDTGAMVCVEREAFKAVEYMANVIIDDHLPEYLSDEVLGTIKRAGVPAYATLQKKDDHMMRSGYVVRAGWLEYFEARPALPRCKRARIKERRRLFAEEHGSYRAWIRRVKLLRREFGKSWRWCRNVVESHSPLSKLGSWSSLWPGNVY